MKTYINMNRAFIIQLMTLLFLVTVTANAQRRKKHNNEKIAVNSELARVGAWFRQWPVQIDLHFTHRAIPAMSARDSAETDMVFFCSNHEFYMQAEGMEQIVNDSVLVLVNNEARMIRVYPNNGVLPGSRAGAIASFMPDTSLEKLAKQYSSTLQDESPSVKRIILQSRDHIPETDLEKELINISYQAGNYQPLFYKNTKRSVVPIDSLTYSRLAADIAWMGRLTTTRSTMGNLFFVVKENITECRFSSINYGQKAPPVRIYDRVVKADNGEYQPAKGFESYNVSQE